jgi:hypothetical protein
MVWRDILSEISAANQSYWKTMHATRLREHAEIENNLSSGLRPTSCFVENLEPGAPASLVR